ncbi:MAG: response regulator [Bacteroidia bacterium]
MRNLGAPYLCVSMRSRPLTVLTVDDSEIVYKMLGMVFSETKNITWLGHVYYLEEAKTSLSEKPPHVVILDIHFKEETSFGLLEYIHRNHPDIVVIMLSNIATPPYRKKCKELGAAYFLDKSIEFEKLSGLLKSLSATE